MEYREVYRATVRDNVYMLIFNILYRKNIPEYTYTIYYCIYY